MSPPRAKCWQVVSESEFRAFIANFPGHMPEVCQRKECGVMLREFVDTHGGLQYPQNRVAYESLDVRTRARRYHIFATRPPYQRAKNLVEECP